MDILDEYFKYDMIVGDYYSNKLKLEEINKNIKNYKSLIDVCNQKLKTFSDFLLASIKNNNYEFYIDKVMAENISLIQLNVNLEEETKKKEQKEEEVNKLYKIVLQNMEKQKKLRLHPNFFIFNK
jgi:uncharacterized protein YutD